MMYNFRRPYQLVTAVGLLLLGLLALSVNTSHANVTLIYFRGESTDDGIALEWRTGSEFETAGYVIKRATSPNNFAALDDDSDVIPVIYEGSTVTVVPAAGDAATYPVLDTDVVDGTTYYYLLVELEFDNTRINPDNGSTSVTAGSAPTATPVGIGIPPTATPSSSGNPTNTPVPTNTPAPTSTQPPPPTATPRPAATATPRPAATSTPVPAATDTSALPTATAQSFGDDDDAFAPAATNTPVSVGPVATADSAENGTNPIGGVPVAEAAQDEYPGDVPTVEPPLPGYDTTNESGEVNTTTLDDGSGTGYDSAEPGRIGDESGLPVPSSDNVGQEDGAGGNNRLILWGGFAAALLVFVGGVIGSIIIFNRR